MLRAATTSTPFNAAQALRVAACAFLVLTFAASPARAAQDLPPACLALAAGAPRQTTTPQDKLADPYWAGQYALHKTASEERGIDLLLLGDSITNRWPKDLMSVYFRGYKPLNLGLEGDKTQNLLWRLQNGPFLAHKPKDAILLIGTNNPDSEEDIEAGIVAILQTIRNASPDTRVFLVGILPREPWEAKRDKIEQINYAIKACAQPPRIYVMNFGPLFLNPLGQPNPSFYNPDKLHLSSLGYLLLSQELKKAMDAYD